MIGALALLSYYKQGWLFSPGQLHKGHVNIKNCKACHEPFSKPDGTLCSSQDCHGSAYWLNRVSLSAGHKKKTGCVNCHTEHLGSNAKITLVAAHAEIYPEAPCIQCHQLSPNHGKPKSADCRDCHSITSWKPANFDHTKMEGSAACATCHLLPAKHIQVGSDCKKCHDITSWKPAKFDHKFPLSHGKKFGANSECKTCHPDSLEKYDCYLGCHEHTKGEVANEHLEEGIRGYSDCVKCHPTGREHEKPGDRGDRKGEHSRSYRWKDYDDHDDD